MLTFAIGLIDGFSACAMWGLTFLLSPRVGIGDRARIVAIAGTFVLVSGLVVAALAVVLLFAPDWLM